MATEDTARAAALESGIREALELLARGAAADAAQVLEATLEGFRPRALDDDLTTTAVLALQAMVQDLSARTRSPADCQALLGAQDFGVRLGADADQLVAVIAPQALAREIAAMTDPRRAVVTEDRLLRVATRLAGEMNTDASLMDADDLEVARQEGYVQGVTVLAAELLGSVPLLHPLPKEPLCH